ncbi:hypothetical protein HK104_000704 [Borealophlyctis nickersoniae]|nr:hypothetical protein HK104_000704 [Borealophlyctis nickersoniae]
MIVDIQNKNNNNNKNKNSYKMIVKEIHVLSLTGEKHLSVEAGSVLSGMVAISLQSDAKDLRAVVTLCGTEAVHWPDSLRTGSYTHNAPFVTARTDVYDGRLKGMGGTLPKGTHYIPFTIDTKRVGLRPLNLEDLPHTYRYNAAEGSDIEKGSAGSASIRYWLRGVVSIPGKLTTNPTYVETTTKLTVVPPLRAKRLGCPFSYLIGNVVAPGSPRTERWPIPLKTLDRRHVRWNLAISRRACLPGDAVDCLVIAQANPGRAIAHVTISLRETTTFSTATHRKVPLSDPPTRVLAAVRETSLGYSSGVGDGPILRTIPITIPRDAKATIQTRTLSNIHVLRLSIQLQDEEEPCTVIELPFTIVQPDFDPMTGRVIPPKAIRNESLGWMEQEEKEKEEEDEQLPTLSPSGSETSEGDGSSLDGSLSDSVSSSGSFGAKLPSIIRSTPSVIRGRFKATYSFVAKKPDEMDMQAGDAVYVSRSFEDGWVKARNESTGVTGVVPLHHLQEILEDESRLLLAFPKFNQSQQASSVSGLPPALD